MYEYKRIEGDSPLFLFRSKYNYDFQVSFSIMDRINDIDIYSITIDCLEKGKKINDPIVGLTVHNIVSTLLDEYKTSLFTYICDSDDNKENIRQRKFNGWYELHNNNKHMLRAYDVNIPELDTTYYSALIFDSETYTVDYIDNFYDTEIKNLTNKPN